MIIKNDGDKLGIDVSTELKQKVEIAGGGVKIHNGGIPANSQGQKCIVLDYADPSIGGEGGRLWIVGDGGDETNEGTQGRLNIYLIDGSGHQLPPNEFGVLHMSGPFPGHVGVGHRATNPKSQLDIVQHDYSPDAGIRIGGAGGDNECWQVFTDENGSLNFRWAATGATPLKLNNDGTVTLGQQV